MRKTFDRFENWYTRHFKQPQFEHLGYGHKITRPWNLDLYGPGIRAGRFLHLYNTRGLITRLTVWTRPETKPFIDIGDHVLISPGFMANAAAGITIGNDVMIASFVYISDSDWHGVYDRGSEPKTNMPVHLEDNCWIGYRAIIGKGVRIGRNSIVGAGSVVVNSIPANVIAAGNPARVVKELDPDLPMRTRAAIFSDPQAYEEWNRALMEVELKNNTTYDWTRARLFPQTSD